MLKRIFVGLVLGLVMGSLVAALVVKGLGMLAFPKILAYLFAGVTGVVTGLVAGKPIWAQGGQIEAGLKAGFGALVGVGLMYAMRHWLHLQVDIAPLGAAGIGGVGELPAVSLPLIGAFLAAFYSADNTPEDAASADKSGAKGARLPEKKAPAGKRTRVASSEDDEDVDADVAIGKRSKR
ncbi:hypothetical protein [Pendulispora albinea]|uniref:Uncharacterized protein n=1 Tax=Pendulispora albinea TaxID=2741071 RepID=A0ABZ2LX40_9BACT